MENPPTPGSKRVRTRIVWEAAVVTVAGVLFALAANQLSPRGLALGRNYFPSSPPTNATPTTTLAAQLKASGLQLAEHERVQQLFQDPRYQQELVLFIDARDDKHFQEGHIPGAYQLDHYRKEQYLPVVLAACQMAEQIVIYCTGGTCEDSQFAAITLRDAGIPNEKLFVYAGGMAEWATHKLPVETGPRKSGQLKQP